MEKKQHRIGCVLVDATQDKSQDQYSEGDIENELLAIVREGRREEALRQDTRWPVLYHLSEERQNIVSWLPLKKTDRVLEIGCGCGAITGALCRRAGHVDAVEISPRRAEIAAWRNKDCANLRICVGNLNDLALGASYDVVTLIGVLEYAVSFTHTQAPFHDFLVQCQQYLKPGGRLVIAIENRLGMKYWSGAREDHTGKMYDGILGYPGVRHVRTFSRQELAQLLTGAGFAGQQWYYPYPDYKFPMELHTDRRLPTAEELRGSINEAYDCERLEIFPEKAAFASILPAGLYPEFANSFLVVCGRESWDTEQLPIYVHYAWYRPAPYRIGTAIYERAGKRSVEKFTRSDAARPHLRAIEENGRILGKLYGREHVAASHLVTPDVLACEYVGGTNFTDHCLQAARDHGLQGFVDALNFFSEHIVRGQEAQVPTSFDFDAPSRQYDVDLTYDNVYLQPDGGYKIIDYEFLSTTRSELYAILHALLVFHQHHGALWPQLGISLEFFPKAWHLTQEDWKVFKKDEAEYYHRLLDWYLRRYQRTRQPLEIRG